MNVIDGTVQAEVINSLTSQVERLKLRLNVLMMDADVLLDMLNLDDNVKFDRWTQDHEMLDVKARVEVAELRKCSESIQNARELLRELSGQNGESK